MKRAIPFEEVLAALPKERQEKIAARGREILAEIQQRRSLAELRKHRKISQTQMAATLGINQVQVSRLERRKDPRLSTLQRTVASMGGHLTLIATFPDQEPVILTASSPLQPKMAATKQKTLSRKTA